MKNYLLSAAPLLILGPAAAFALPSSDFYCAPHVGKGSKVTYFEMAEKSCRGESGKTQVTGVCHESVQCTYLPLTVKQQLAEKYSQSRGGQSVSWDDIPHADQIRLLPSEYPYKEWHESIVTCKAGPKLSGKDPVCPFPDECKGDLYFNPKAADFDPVSMVNSMNQIMKNDGVTGFKHETEAKGAK